jgi:hypothetical protein
MPGVDVGRKDEREEMKVSDAVGWRRKEAYSGLGLPFPTTESSRNVTATRMGESGNQEAWKSPTYLVWNSSPLRHYALYHLYGTDIRKNALTQPYIRQFKICSPRVLFLPRQLRFSVSVSRLGCLGLGHMLLIPIFVSSPWGFKRRIAVLDTWLQLPGLLKP